MAQRCPLSRRIPLGKLSNLPLSLFSLPKVPQEGSTSVAPVATLRKVPGGPSVKISLSDRRYFERPLLIRRVFFLYCSAATTLKSPISLPKITPPEYSSKPPESGVL